MSQTAEIDVLEAQLEELLAEPAADISDALEVASVAGMLFRLGVTEEALAQARVWRDGPAGELLAALWPDLDMEPLVDEIEGLADGQATDEALEEALFDFDEVVAAAVWCGKGALVRPAARQVAAFIQLVPDVFAPVAYLGAEAAKLPAVGADYDLYAYWFALAEAGKWAEEP